MDENQNLDISYDPNTDLAMIEEQLYSGDFFRFFAEGSPGELFRLLRRKSDHAWIVQRVDTDGEIDDLRSQLEQARAENARLRVALSNLLEACIQADAIEELCDLIDGSLLDDASDALKQE